MPSPEQTRLPFDQLGSGRTEQLERLAASGLVREGRVFLLSLEPVRAELGAKWPLREEIVWHTFERDLKRAMPPPDQFIRLDETTLLAAVSSTDAYSGQVKCAHVFREALAFFLGRSLDSDLSMSRVSALASDGVVAERIDPAVRPAGPQPSSDAKHALDPGRWAPPLADRGEVLSFLTERDGPVTVEYQMRPVWRLDRRVVAAYAVRRRLPRPLAAFSDKDKETIDLLTASFLAPIMSDYRTHGGAFAILCPFTFTTLSAQNSRMRLLMHCAGFADLMKRAVVLEIDGLDRGAPVGRVRETVSMCRPLARLRTLSIGDVEALPLVMSSHGAQGVALDGETLSGDALMRALGQVSRVTTNLVLHAAPAGLNTEHLRAWGASHVTEAVTQARQPRSASPVQARPEQCDPRLKALAAG